MISSAKSLIITALLAILLAGNLSAQYYSTGVDPASAKWKQIRTENFQVIFQDEFEEQAQKVAGIMEYYYEQAGKTLNHAPKRISIILHNQTILSNGYVAWAPKRVELFTTPPQEALPDPWLEHLCIHELRHVVQLDKLNQGLTKIFSVIFGQQATALVAGQIPMWYYEGDAVSAETAFLNYGRGRSPSFQRGIKTDLLSDEKTYSFDQSLFGSYKTYVPNHYEFGYHLTAYTRKKYGAEVWSNVQNYVARNPYTILPTPFAFYKGLKKNIGLSQKELYHESLNYLDSVWTLQDTTRGFQKTKFIQKYSINEYEDYLNPAFINENQFIALKKGLSHIPQFVLVSEHSEKSIYEPGYVINNDFSFANGVVVWAEYQPDIRWANREYTTIKLLNLEKRRASYIAKKERYFSPDISAKTQRIVVVQVDQLNQSSLVILDKRGEVLKTIQPQSGSFLQKPRWSDSEEFIYAIELTDQGKQISRYNLQTETWEFLFKQENADIQKIVPSENKVLFHSTYNGTDNIYVFEVKSKNIFQLTDSRFGISEFNLSANGNNIIASEYTSQGFRLTTVPIERALWKRDSELSGYDYNLAETLKNQEEQKPDPFTDEAREYDIKPYHKALHLFNFHSWNPFYVDYDNMNLDQVFEDPSEITSNIHPGFSVLSQNKLSTVDAIAAYAYKNGNHFVTSSVVLKGQYPTLRLTANYGSQQLIRSVEGSTWQPISKQGYNYDIDLAVPLSFYKGKYVNVFKPSVSVEYFDNYYYNYEKDYYVNGLEMVNTSLLYSFYQRKAARDIIPEFGGVFKVKLISTPFDQELYGFLHSVNAVFFIPGWGNSGFQLNAGIQYQHPDLYLFSSDLSFPRGIVQQRTEEMLTLYADYVFPIAYPDFSLGSAFYLKRLRGDVFVDKAFNAYRAVNSDQTAIVWEYTDYTSVGVEFIADYHLLRSIFPLNTGVRVGYLPTKKDLFYEMIFGIDLYSF